MLETIALQIEHCTVSDTKLESLIKSERTIVSVFNKNAIATKLSLEDICTAWRTDDVMNNKTVNKK